MPRISILTTEYAPTAMYVEDTINSVTQQVLPEGWDYEWIIQEDGSDPRMGHRLRKIPHVQYEANGSQLGIAATRNLALARASGDLVQLLDHDDVLLPCALSTLLPAFNNPDVHWAVGQADDLLADGKRASWDSALPYGIVPAGAANDWAIDHDGNWPVHCAGLMVRASTLRAIGGWVGIPSDDDIAMFAGLSEVAAGYNEKTVTWLYRQHTQQIHRSEKWKVRESEGRYIAVQRVAALRESGFRLSADAATTSRRIDPDAVVGPISPEKDRFSV